MRREDFKTSATHLSFSLDPLSAQFRESEVLIYLLIRICIQTFASADHHSKPIAHSLAIHLHSIVQCHSGLQHLSHLEIL